MDVAVSLHCIPYQTMIFRYFELKEVIYIGQTALGILLLCSALYQYNLIGSTEAAISHIATAWILFVSGCTCVFFGIETYLLRDDPDIWR